MCRKTGKRQHSAVKNGSTYINRKRNATIFVSDINPFSRDGMRLSEAEIPENGRTERAGKQIDKLQGRQELPDQPVPP